ncbi:MAG TPA: DUF3037 domain-containing protein [Dehalococcoidia bacterium]|nr:DUF3037 domain-containing protein [Dehalococcoidia bacterium]
MWYSYAIIRVVPRVERGEFVNAGIILFARTGRYLKARVELDADRLRALAPLANPALIERHLRAFEAICAGAPEGGPVAALPPSERFHWLTAPRSTVIQTSPVHVGCCPDPEEALEELLATFVRPPAGSGQAAGSR